MQYLNALFVERGRGYAILLDKQMQNDVQNRNGIHTMNNERINDQHEKYKRNTNFFGYTRNKNMSILNDKYKKKNTRENMENAHYLCWIDWIE